MRASHWCLGPPPLTTFSQTRLSGAEDILCPRGERADHLFHSSYPPLMVVLQASATVEGMSDWPPLLCRVAAPARGAARGDTAGARLASHAGLGLTRRQAGRILGQERRQSGCEGADLPSTRGHREGHSRVAQDATCRGPAAAPAPVPRQRRRRVRARARARAQARFRRRRSSARPRS